LRPISFRFGRAKPWRGLLQRQSLARRVEAAEPVFHVFDLVANPLVCGLQAQAVGREALSAKPSV
jgi:hypothetical protein